MLERFRKAKQAEIDALLRQKEAGTLPAPWQGERPGFAAALRAGGPGAVIAEYKRASPSRGVINESLGPVEAARAYAAGGAAAMSVLTEEPHFRGRMEYLFEAAGHGLPLLRKDFLYHPVQVTATAATPASALLVIARCFKDADALGEMLRAAEGAGLEAVTEIFDERDLDVARKAGAAIIQVNNRDLDTLAVDTDLSLRLAKRRAAGETWISASGVSKRATVLAMARAGYDAVLVGTWLMAGRGPGEDPEARTRLLAGN